MFNTVTIMFTIFQKKHTFTHIQQKTNIQFSY